MTAMPYASGTAKIQIIKDNMTGKPKGYGTLDDSEHTLAFDRREQTHVFVSIAHTLKFISFHPEG